MVILSNYICCCLFIIVFSLVPGTNSQYGIIGNTCSPTSPSQIWKYDLTSGQLSTTTLGYCLTVSSYPPTDGTSLMMSPCVNASSLSSSVSYRLNPLSQAFDIVSSNNTLVLRTNHTQCINLAGYGTSPGTSVWLYGCDPLPYYSCQGNCDWEPITNEHYQNNESGLCLDDGYTPPMVRTCDPRSPAYAYPLCNSSLPLPERVDDLVSRLSLDYKIQLIMLPLPPSVNSMINSTFPLAAFHWDITTIHGVSTCCDIIQPLPDATSFPHAIAQGASFDLDLAVRIANAVAYEARIINQMNFNLTNGQSVQALNAEGGPLANTVHDPRYGRAQETYGEDVYLSSRFGVAITTALQNRSTDHPFIQLSSVTRHYLGYHGTTDLPNGGEEWINVQWLADQQLPIYKAHIMEGEAEGVMCSINTLRVGDGDGSVGGIPACVHPLLYDILYNQWNSTTFVQTDNDSLYAMYAQHNYYPNLTESVINTIRMGAVAIDSGMGTDIIQAVYTGLSTNALTVQDIDNFVKRTFLMRFKLGEFDSNNPINPYNSNNVYNVSKLDGPEHRQLAREAATKTTVLLRNGIDNDHTLLPLSLQSPPPNIAIIGPWGACSDLDGSYGCNMCFGGNYNAKTSYVSSILSAMNEVVGNVSNVTYALGTNPYTYSSPTGIEEAVNVAAASNVAIVVLGLGCQYETESIDRPDLYLPNVQDELLSSISLGVNRSRTQIILVTVSAGIIDIDEALIDAWLQFFIPGEEAGHALTDILFGTVSPSARLPLTGYSNEYLQICGPVADFNMVSLSGNIGRTYRFANYIPSEMIKLYFGYGLSYSTFTYSNLNLQYLTNPVSMVNVTVTVTNNGPYTLAREIVQVYVRVPTVTNVLTPLHNLQSFTVIAITEGSNNAVQVTLSLPYPNAFLTTLTDGSRIVTGGLYTVFVSGHQPNDNRGTLLHSNVLNSTITLPPS